MRENNILGVRIYWKSMAGMYIPHSLLESTKNSKDYIFDAVSPEEMVNLMKKSFDEERLIDDFSIYSTFTLNTRVDAVEEALNNGRPRIKAEVLITKIQVNITPNKLNDLLAFMETFENLLIRELLKSYRPRRRPITVNRSHESEKYKRKRYLIVRDWFFYGLWAIRLKKAIKPSKKVKPNKLNDFQSLYEAMKSKTEGNNERTDLINFMKQMKQKIDLEVSKKEQKLIDLQKKLMGVKVTTRYQGLSISCYSNSSPDPIITFQIIVLFNII